VKCYKNTEPVISVNTIRVCLIKSLASQLLWLDFETLLKGVCAAWCWWNKI
jgi:hypothetical protein